MKKVPWFYIGRRHGCGEARFLCFFANWWSDHWCGIGVSFGVSFRRPEDDRQDPAC